MDNFFEFIVEEALIVVPVLWVFGGCLKRTPSVPDWTIPWFLLAGGIGLTGWLMGFTPSAVLQGVLVAGAAVFGHQLLVQTIYREG